MERHVYDRMAEIDRDHWWFVGRRKILTALIERVLIGHIHDHLNTIRAAG